MSAVDASLDGGVLTLTLNRPEKRNALNAAIVDGLAAGIAQAEFERGGAGAGDPRGGEGLLRRRGSRRAARLGGQLA
ncbi:MAG: hypothetical protein V9E87_15040 [Gemmatimonadales bacterium]